MRISELTRADRITGRSDGKRNLKTERSAMRRLLKKRAELGLVEKIGRGRWGAIYPVISVAILIALAMPAAAQNQTTFRDSSGRTVGTASTDSQGTVTFRDSGGRTTGTASTDSQGTTTFRDSGGRTTGTATGPRR